MSTNIEQKGGGRVNLLELRHLSSALGHQHSWFLDFWTQAWIYTIDPKILRLLNLDRIIPPVFLVLQFTDSRLWDFLASITTWTNSYNKSHNKFLNNYLYILLILSLWRTLTNAWSKLRVDTLHLQYRNFIKTKLALNFLEK